MMNSIIKYTSIFILLAGLSCTKGVSSSANSGETKCTISIGKPLQADSYNQGDKMLIKITFAGKQGNLEGYHINIRNKTDGSLVFNKSLKLKQPTMNANEEWVNNVSATSEMELEAIALTDTLGGTEWKKIYFTAKH
jgi:hypothetical protein